ncbi:LysR family transcriptional regulator ArgP [Protaetiibacter mangrovi]|uniref:LysR family transcriptional regulator ArgP n=1 Tax=Protaetiibacter mangrovi TaxID=2970926 RepID=A0ABT1ZG98_9MICO|nr:LysR family transcriptional regulator ArgP [Protaetiibacter mangrovi]MCS0499660.1 LysR family transcriptional regulator ArgP [Protaetiibacter mangrovi]TPX02775.1 LysR family transcriptional regulator ArgP [Schumannella luteola]
MNLDNQQLATLRAVVDAGTFDAAARALSVTPSAVSQRIRALEQQLGRVLVERTKPVRATESGEVLVRLAREIALLETDAASALRLDDEGDGFTTVSLAVNADSLTSWFLPAIADVCAARRIVVDIHREDQDRTAELLASGRVMAAVTSQAEPVSGCSSTPLGVLVYRPSASRAFAERWFPDGADAASLARAPLVDFDHDDELQTRFLRRASRRRLDPPRHFVSGSSDFLQAIELGLGWGMLLESQLADATSGTFVELDPDGPGVAVPLHWQQWNLRSPGLDALADAVIAAARTALRRR